MGVILIRDVTRKECPWLPRDLPEGTEVHLYHGYTYGCVTDTGTAVTLHGPQEGPFYEIPNDAIGTYHVQVLGERLPDEWEQAPEDWQRGAP